MHKFHLGLTAMLVLGTTVMAADKKVIGLGGKSLPNLPKVGNFGQGNGNNGFANQQLKPQVVKPAGKKFDLPKFVEADQKKVVAGGKQPDFKKAADQKVVAGNKQVLDLKKIDFKNPDFKNLPKLNGIDKKILGEKLQNVNQQGSQNNLLKLSPKIQLNNYQLKYGMKKSFGYCYQGFDHCHWTYCCWWGPSNCYCYWCPCTCVYYYWCVPDQCWYPITFCPYGVYYW